MVKVTVEAVRARKGTGDKLTMLTAYDYPLARLLDESGVDVVLVGDSLGMVVLGYETTAAVTMAEMLHHAKAVRRGMARALLIGDLPLEALRGSPADVVRDARRFVGEAGCEAVKVEWRSGMDAVAHAVVAAGIPVMGHVGLTPQAATSRADFTPQGRDPSSAARILEEAQRLEAAGCFAMVLECIPDLLAREITQRLSIPTIGIGSGPFCDGQVLVTYDLLGLFERFTPRFVKRYADVAGTVRQAVAAYLQEIKSGAFPGQPHTVAMGQETYEALQRLLPPR